MYTLPRGLARDSSALTPLAFAVLPLLFATGCVLGMARNGSDPLGWAIVAVCAAVVAALAGVSALVFSRDRRRALSARGDLFAANGWLLSISWMEDRKAHGTSGKGILRIHAVRLDECRVYHSEKDGAIWVVPARPGALRDIWRRDRTWEQRRAVCAQLIKSGRVSAAGDTDPFVGVPDVFRPFLEDLGLRVEETTEPIDFLAGTARFGAPVSRGD